MQDRYNHKAKFMNQGRVEPAPGLEFRRAEREDAEEFWRQNDRELAQERAARQRLIARVGLKTVLELEATARQLEQERFAEWKRAQQRRQHERTMEAIRRRVARDQADERKIERLKAAGVRETDLRIKRIRVTIQARALGVEV